MTQFLFLNVKEIIELNDGFEDIEVIELPISMGILNEKNVSNMGLREFCENGFKLFGSNFYSITDFHGEECRTLTIRRFWPKFM